MEISVLRVLLGSISSFLNLSSSRHIGLDPLGKYYKRVEDLLRVLKPVIDVVVNSDIDLEDKLVKEFEELARDVDQSRELFRSWQPFSSKVYFVLQIESFMLKMRDSIVDTFQLLKTSQNHLPDELNPGLLERCLEKIKHLSYEEISSVIDGALRDQRDGVGPSPEILVKIGEETGLRSNQEILIEAVSLEKQKEIAEQTEKNGEVEFLDQLISVVNRMHERLLLIKQTQTSSSIPILADFFCPLSLEVMTDPVIVSSGQTYERAFIKKWIDLGLTVCPKTRQTLNHTTLIPNYTVKALIVNWCETNNVRLPDPTKSTSLNELSPLLSCTNSIPNMDANVFARIGSNQPNDLDPSAGAPGKNSFSTSVVEREGASPSHLPSSLDASLPGLTGNGHGLDIGRMSLNDFEDRSNNSREMKTDAPGRFSVSSTRRGSVDAAENGQVSEHHYRSASASSTVSNEEFPRVLSADGNENSEESAHATPYTSDASGEMRREPLTAAASSATPRRDSSEFSPKLMDRRTRGQSFWRRPSERLGSRIVSAPSNETRRDLSEVETQVKKLVEELKSGSVDTQRKATGEIRLLAKHNMDNRIVIANCGAISLLVDLLYSSDSETQEHAVTALLNLSINDNNKRAIADAGAIEPLIHVLQTGSSEAKENSAATLFSLSVIEENKIKIGRSGAIGPLVDLLGTGTPRGKKDAATALFNLSIHHENKARIVQAGAVRHLIDLMDPAGGMVDKAVAVMANLATIPEGRNGIGQEGGIPLLVEVVELGSARGKENAAAALLQLCTNSGRFCNMVLQEGAIPPLVALSQSGTPRAREKAQALLSYFRNQRHGNAGRG
ncbi:PREDICTED: U-box domain-containing protein 4 [Tarenaya hassleriana]|uniref:U-box domain-containing protein 4 n=1 Tax=Tarenaya hassleriana TaxID=28532 RepID=UPI00053C7279|nr:PREDICTED: U-box domain-containing protein 4 [Tarenaya hassleriana]XP_010531284.1 PREDICTED: U-box domain-containing protein 4 [Tarenaya hassleriana]XP_010531285.1 PREDICTED: U-box domain-containing protein 4 [Tarenaya hassleriana]XP_010531286.1 PREDICTED: U-box domain-containing protein 4 [Tarenaya hassleriana]